MEGGRVAEREREMRAVFGLAGGVVESWMWIWSRRWEVFAIEKSGIVMLRGASVHITRNKSLGIFRHG